MGRHKNGVIALLLIFSAYLPAAIAQPDEQLDYRIYYRGLLSGMVKIDICDAVLNNSRYPTAVIAGEPVKMSQIKISSESFKKMELLYPFRFEMSSYFTEDLQRIFLFDRKKTTNKVSHKIVQFDWIKQVAIRFKLRQKTQKKLPVAALEKQKTDALFEILGYNSEQFYLTEKQGQKLPVRLFDWLSMLQSIRNDELVVGYEARYAVSNGKESEDYLVSFEKTEPFIGSESKNKFIKIKLSALGDKKSSSPSFFIWMTADKQKTPVRFSVDFAMGKFVAQLTGVTGWPELEE